MQSGRGNNSFHNNFIESSYFNQIISTRRILSNILDVLHDQEVNMRSVLLNNSLQNISMFENHQSTLNANMNATTGRDVSGNMNSNRNINNNTNMDNNTNINNNTNMDNNTNNSNIFSPSSIFSNRTTTREREEFNQTTPRRPLTRRGIHPPTSHNHSQSTRGQTNRLDGNERENIISRFLNLANLDNEINNNNTIQFDFFAPIIVRPTQQQINVATRRLIFREIEDPINRICQISQENFNLDDEVIQIRHCRHNFTPQHFNTWFSRNVRCPCCRFDIRDHVNQEHSARETQSNSHTQATHLEEPAPATIASAPAPAPAPATIASAPATIASAPAPAPATIAPAPATIATAHRDNTIENTIEDTVEDTIEDTIEDTVEINVNTPESLNSMITMISNSLTRQLEDSGLDPTSNISIQYSVVDNSNSNLEEELDENNDN